MPLIPRDKGFFDLFNALSSKMQASAELLARMFEEPARLDEYVAAIKVIEHEADVLTHEVRTRIDRSFVTPLDREDIHALAQELDTVVDLMDGTARRAAMFRIREALPPAQQLAGLLQQSAGVLGQAVREVKNPRAVTEHTLRVKHLEEQGDAVYHDGVGALFEGTPDPITVIKWKELYDTLERALDRCQTAAIVLESISLKNS